MAKQKKQPKRYLFEEVLAFLQHNSGKSFNYKQIGAAMELNAEADRLQLMEVLAGLCSEGFVKEEETGRFTAKDNKQYVSGIIDFTQQGTAFVMVDGSDSDIFIPAKKTGEALNRDLVKVFITSRPKGGRRQEGEVTEVIQRAKT
ncbi:MAG: hypothetical protein ACXVPD_08380, partial [Bacteroidia bacterium]